MKNIYWHDNYDDCLTWSIGWSLSSRVKQCLQSEPAPARTEVRTLGETLTARLEFRARLTQPNIWGTSWGSPDTRTSCSPRPSPIIPTSTDSCKENIALSFPTR